MLSVIFGLVGIIGGAVWLIAAAWQDFLTVLNGGVPPFLILVGLVAVAAGISSIKDNMAAKKEEAKIDEETSKETAAPAEQPAAPSEPSAPSEEEKPEE